MPASHEPGAQHVEIVPLMVVTQAFPARPSALPDVRDFVRRQLTTTPVSDDDIRTLCERVADVLLDAAGESTDIQVSLRIFPESAEVDVLHTSARDPAIDPDRGAGPWAERGAGPALDRGASLLPGRSAGSSSERFAGSPSERLAGSPPERFTGSPPERFAGSSSEGFAGSPPGRGGSPWPEHGALPRPEHGALPQPEPGGRIAEQRYASTPPAVTGSVPAENAAGTGSPSFAAWLAARLRAEGMTMEAAARRLEVSTKTISRWVSGTTEPRLRDLYRIRDVFGEPPFH